MLYVTTKYSVTHWERITYLGGGGGGGGSIQYSIGIYVKNLPDESFKSVLFHKTLKNEVFFFADFRDKKLV